MGRNGRGGVPLASSRDSIGRSFLSQSEGLGLFVAGFESQGDGGLSFAVRFRTGDFAFVERTRGETVQPRGLSQRHCGRRFGFRRLLLSVEVTVGHARIAWRGSRGRLSLLAALILCVERERVCRLRHGAVLFIKRLIRVGIGRRGQRCGRPRLGACRPARHSAGCRGRDHPPHHLAPHSSHAAVSHRCLNALHPPRSAARGRTSLGTTRRRGIGQLACRGGWERLAVGKPFVAGQRFLAEARVDPGRNLLSFRDFKIRGDHLRRGAHRRDSDTRRGAPGRGVHGFQVGVGHDAHHTRRGSESAVTKEPTPPLGRGIDRNGDNRRVEGFLDPPALFLGQADLGFEQEFIGEHGGGGADLVDVLQDFGATGDRGLDFRLFSGVEFIERVSGQPGIVQVQGHGITSIFPKVKSGPRWADRRTNGREVSSCRCGSSSRRSRRYGR